MAFFKVAMVNGSDYPVLRTIIPGLPQNFDEWKLKQDTTAAQHRSGSHKVEMVEFNPGALAKWCKGSRLNPTEDVLHSWISAGCPRPWGE
jgi:hypothetical protein